MKAKVLLTAVLSVVFAGCTLRGKPNAVLPPAAPKPAATPAAAPAPPPPLSIPQTQVELPKPQPVDPAALMVDTTPREPEPEPQLALPARSKQRTTPAATPTPPAAAPTPEPPRETFREIVSPSESKRLTEQAQGRRREVNQILDQLSRRTLSNAQKSVMATIRNFLALSLEAEGHNDPRGADSLAERAQILAKELQSEQ
jgi:hypothetical protein